MAIVVGAHGASTATTTTVNAVSATVSLTAGRCAVVAITIRNNTSQTVGTVVDSVGSTVYTKVAGAVATNSTNVRVEIWTSTATGIIGSPTSVTVTLAAAATARFEVFVAEYSGVGSIGTSTVATGASGAATITLGGLSASTSKVVAGLAATGTTTMTSGTGALENAQASSGGVTGANVSGALVDNTGSTSVTCATASTSTAWSAGAVELVVPAVVTPTGFMAFIVGRKNSE